MAEIDVQMRPPVIRDGKVEFPLDPNTGVRTPQSISINTDQEARRNHIDWGYRANEWTSRYIIMAANRVMDFAYSGGWNKVCVARMRSAFKAEASYQNTMELARERARIAKRYGCGNCEEMSATALVWLLDYYMTFNQYSSTTLAWMEVTNGDHLFVLIGFPPGKASVTAEWGPRSVVVDPWNDKVYPGVDIRKVRWNSASEVYTPLLEIAGRSSKRP